MAKPNTPKFHEKSMEWGLPWCARDTPRDTSLQMTDLSLFPEAPWLGVTSVPTSSSRLLCLV